MTEVKDEKHIEVKKEGTKEAIKKETTEVKIPEGYIYIRDVYDEDGYLVPFFWSSVLLRV